MIEYRMTQSSQKESFPTLLTIVDNLCLYQVYNNNFDFMVFQYSWYTFDLSGER
jgi:hypothetical protein